eukprot:CAMPEP_0114515828 /NCGR_PEP_ID=MMETSP0109-20121206/16974_1 /TAXON_ID=29199 /ORGANISM="Chlorarachnion reptans, Strain CCCM449" /LENGTH=697 /DNA_ID=CAMNT_0001696119 /DNA_START=178 /DNA_END=2267 /DNA_ORIENTATION=-
MQGDEEKETENVFDGLRPIVDLPGMAGEDIFAPNDRKIFGDDMLIEPNNPPIPREEMKPQQRQREQGGRQTKEIFTCPFGQCNETLQGKIEGCLYPEKKLWFCFEPHECEYMRRPKMVDSWGVGMRIRCPACDKPIQVISPAEPQRFNKSTFVTHLLSHFDADASRSVYPKEVQIMLEHSMTLKAIYTQICTEYLAMVWPRKFYFQAGVNYPFQWPERLKGISETLQDINIDTKLKKNDDGKGDLETRMTRFKEQYFQDAKSFNYEKKASVIKFVLSYPMDFDNLEHRYHISKIIQTVIRNLLSDKPDFLKDIEDRGMRRGSIQAILLCHYYKAKASDFMNFLRNEMPHLAEYEGIKPTVLRLDHMENAHAVYPVVDPQEKKSENPTGAAGGTWPWYTALEEEGGSVYMWKKELKDLQEYICEGKREASTVLATHDLLHEKCAKEKTDSKIKGPYSHFKASGGWAQHPGAVLIQLDVRGISNVEVDRGTFEMSAYIRVVFYDPTATKVLPIGNEKKTYEQIYGNKSDEELEGYCVPPLIRTRNAVEGDALHEGWGVKEPKKFNPSDHKGIWIQELFLKNIKFHEDFQLEDFPFDTQTCAVIFALVHTKSNRSRFNYGGTYKEQKVRPPQFLLPWLGQMKMRAPLKEYQLYKPDVRTHSNLHFKKESRSSQLLIHRTSIRRKYSWYVYDLMLPLGFTG